MWVRTLDAFVIKWEITCFNFRIDYLYSREFLKTPNKQSLRSLLENFQEFKSEWKTYRRVKNGKTLVGKHDNILSKLRISSFRNFKEVHHAAVYSQKVHRGENGLKVPGGFPMVSSLFMVLDLCARWHQLRCKCFYPLCLMNKCTQKNMFLSIVMFSKVKICAENMSEDGSHTKKCTIQYIIL